MDLQKQKHPELKRVGELIGKIKVAMLTTVDGDGCLRSRPLQTLQMDAAGTLWFFLSASSSKVDEIDRHEHQLNLGYASPDQQNYVSVSGSGRVVRDRAKMEQLWTPWAKVWFPNGLEDPDLALLQVKIEKAEFWDSPGNPVQRLYGLAKALTTGDKSGLGDNRRVEMAH